VRAMDAHTLQEIKDSIRTIPDYPKPGVMFRDITTFSAPLAFSAG
jgi:adenine phosphoribosyltransferase